MYSGRILNLPQVHRHLRLRLFVLDRCLVRILGHSLLPVDSASAQQAMVSSLPGVPVLHDIRLDNCILINNINEHHGVTY